MPYSINYEGSDEGLQYAVHHAKDGNGIYLTSDIVLHQNFMIKKEITLDLNGWVICFEEKIVQRKELNCLRIKLPTFK